MSLMPTMTKLNLADSRMPQISTTVMKKTIATARMLKTMGMPKMCGALATSAGIFAAAVR